MPSQTASSSPARSSTHAAAVIRPAARRTAAPARRSARSTRQPLAHDGALPSYCERQPAAMLDDGWIDESPEAPDELEALESGEDVLIDFDGLEDSR